ncbi:hypothetical protein GY45DRAFT_52064 [Cubamyces sp. BRFM 1775]|nr:hypothetical protein GY45DRAFT_52064 [Cubamyces sp. BRFM 1775]
MKVLVRKQGLLRSSHSSPVLISRRPRAIQPTRTRPDLLSLAALLLRAARPSAQFRTSPSTWPFQPSRHAHLALRLVPARPHLKLLVDRSWCFLVTLARTRVSYPSYAPRYSLHLITTSQANCFVMTLECVLSANPTRVRPHRSHCTAHMLRRAALSKTRTRDPSRFSVPSLHSASPSASQKASIGSDASCPLTARLEGSMMKARSPCRQPL